MLRFLLLFHVLMLLSCANFNSAVQRSDSKSSVDKLASGLYSFRFGDRRSLFLVGDKGVVVTDPISVEAAKIYRQEIRKITKKPISYLVYSNSFFDSVQGGRSLIDDNTQVVSHKNCQKNLISTPHPDIVVPSKTYNDNLSLSVGGASVELYYFGESYGTCLSVIIVKPANVMLVYGLINPDKASIPDDPTLANYYLHNILPFFNRVDELASLHQVTGIAGSFVNEKDVLLSPIRLIAEQKRFWELLLSAVEAEYNRGIPARAIGNRLDKKQFSEFVNYDEQAMKIMTRRVYSLYRIGR